METESALRILDSDEIAEKIFELTEQFHRYAFANPEVLDAIPDEAVLVFLDEADPVFNSANIRLANQREKTTTGGMVYINMKMATQTVDQTEWQAEIVSDWRRLQEFGVGNGSRRSSRSRGKHGRPADTRRQY